MTKFKHGPATPGYKEVIRPVTDELAGIRRVLTKGADEVESYALGLAALQSIPSAYGHLQFHGDVGNSGSAELYAACRHLYLPVMHAMMLLTASARIAIGLLPARTPLDADIKAFYRTALEDETGSPTTGGMVVEPLHALAYDLSDALPEAHLPLALPLPTEIDVDCQSGFAARPGIPAAHSFWQLRSLAVFGSAQPDLRDLVQFAHIEFAKADRWRAQVANDGSTGSVMLNTAAYCAQLRGYSALASVGIWPALNNRDQRSKAQALALAKSRQTELPKFRAAVELSIDIGRSLTAFRQS